MGENLFIVGGPLHGARFVVAGRTMRATHHGRVLVYERREFHLNGRLREAFVLEGMNPDEAMERFEALLRG